MPMDKIVSAVKERVLGEKREDGDWEGYGVGRLFRITSEF